MACGPRVKRGAEGVGLGLGSSSGLAREVGDEPDERGPPGGDHGRGDAEWAGRGKKVGQHGGKD